MDSRELGASSFQLTTHQQRQSAVTAQLFKASATMQHIDELFLWVAQTVVQGFHVQVAEVWVVQNNVRGKPSVYLRTLVREDTTLPQYIVANEQIAILAENLLSMRSSFSLRATGEIFSSHQATLLRRYGLNYCTGHFVSSSMLLPVARTSSLSDETIPTPLLATTLLFLRQPLPAQMLMMLNQMTEQAGIVAESRGLLLSSASTSDRLPVISPTAFPHQGDNPLAKLIPHRSENAQLLRSSNPLSNSVVISDKAARRLYTIIDGHKSVEDLARATHMEMKAVFLALQTLWQEQRIQMYDTTGQLVDSTRLFSGR